MTSKRDEMQGVRRSAHMAFCPEGVRLLSAYERAAACQLYEAASQKIIVVGQEAAAALQALTDHRDGCAVCKGEYRVGLSFNEVPE